MSRVVCRSRLPSTGMLISAPWGRRTPSSLAGPVRPISTATVVVMIRSKKRNWKSLRLVLIWEGEMECLQLWRGSRGVVKIRSRKSPGIPGYC